MDPNESPGSFQPPDAPGPWSSPSDLGRVAIYVDWPNISAWLRERGVTPDITAMVHQLQQHYRPARFIIYKQTRTFYPGGKRTELEVQIALPPLPSWVTVKPRNTNGEDRKLKDVDTMIVNDMALTAGQFGATVLLSGDGDYWFTLQALVDRGTWVEVYGPSGSTHRELKNVAHVFHDVESLAGLSGIKPAAPSGGSS